MLVNHGLSLNIENFIGPIMAKAVSKSNRPLHHFGIAMSDIRQPLPDSLQRMRLLEDSPMLTDPVQQVSAIFCLEANSGCRFELLEPIGEHSPITRFLERTGGGLHHVCFESVNLDVDVLCMREEGARVICAPVPACGFQGARIAFFYTREKLLVELVEAPVTYPRLVKTVLREG